MKISLITPYYDDPYRLEEALVNECLFHYFDEFILVDDASQLHPAQPIVENFLEDYPQYTDRLSLYRVRKDYGFNAHGARNLAMKMIRNEWALLIDIDQLLAPEFCEELVNRIANCPEDEFILCNLYGNDPGNIFAVRASHFWAAGGYDEELRGWHMGDKIFRARLDAIAKGRLTDAILPCNRKGRLVHISEDVSFTEYPNDKIVVQRGQKHIQPTIEMVLARNPEDIPHVLFDYDRLL